jgi:hypothetical protein
MTQRSSRFYHFYQGWGIVRHSLIQSIPVDPDPAGKPWTHGETSWWRHPKAPKKPAEGRKYECPAGAKPQCEGKKPSVGHRSAKVNPEPLINMGMGQNPGT